jgi:DNA-binding MarR family transcriptional regulator
MDKREFLSRYINGEASREDFVSYELASLSAEELIERVFSILEMPVPEDKEEQRQIIKEVGRLINKGKKKL